MQMKYLHTMVRVADLDASVAFFSLLGLEETRRWDNDAGRFTLVFMAPPGQLMDNGITINRPPREGRMAFVRSPDNISIELLQEGDNLPLAEPWASMENIGHW